MNGENPSETGRLRKQLGGTALVAAVLAWGFASSEALLPLRVVAELPAELGRTVASGLFGGQAVWPRLMPAGVRSLPQGDVARFMAGALGLLAGVLASAALVWLARAPDRARWTARALGILLIVASLFPPYGLVESLPALIAGAALLGLGVLGTPAAAAQALLLGAVWSGLSALWQMEGPLFRSGRPGPDLDALSMATGLPAWIWSALGGFICALSWWWVLRSPRAAAIAPEPPPAANASI